VENICRELDISVQNVYATNIFKYFYSIPPADTPNVLIKHKTQNIELLRKEIECYKDSPIITLGEPVLRLLTNEGEKVRNYWNFQERGYKYLSPDTIS